MRFPLALACMAAAALALAACATAKPPPDRVAEGRQIATTLCIECHRVSEAESGPAVRGGPAFPVIAGRPDLTDGVLNQFLQETHWPMPNLLLSFNQREAVIAYIRTLRRS